MFDLFLCGLEKRLQLSHICILKGNGTERELQEKEGISEETEIWPLSKHFFEKGLLLLQPQLLRTI